jgi:hypothetical protein
MIDLNQIVEHFLDEAIRQCRNGGSKDEAVIRSLNDRIESTEVRRSELLKWLWYHGVLQGLHKADRNAVASAIVEFADARVASSCPTTEEEIIKKFDDLYGRCSSKVRLKKDHTPRSLVSLTSKALWCCYPDSIPLFDAYSQRALWILSRLMGLERSPQALPPYHRFVSLWLNLYRCVERTIGDGDRLGGYPYKVRVFDRILWIIGEPDYGESSGQATNAPQTARWSITRAAIAANRG